MWATVGVGIITYRETTHPTKRTSLGLLDQPCVSHSRLSRVVDAVRCADVERLKAELRRECERRQREHDVRKVQLREGRGCRRTAADACRQRDYARLTGSECRQCDDGADRSGVH